MKKFKNISFNLLLACVLSGCTLLGMELQDGYDYPETHASEELGVDVMTFIKSRPELFSGMLEAIEYVNDPALTSLYTTPGNTYFLLTNTALIDIYTTASYFNVNRIEKTPNNYIIPGVWSQFPKEQVSEMLKYHILKGIYGFEQMTVVNPTWLDTYASGDTAKVSMYIPAGDRYGYMFINNYPGVPTAYRIPGTSTNISFASVRPRTPNLMATNGRVHVMDRWLMPPVKEAFN